MQPEEKWKLDRRIPIVLIFSLFIQLGAAIIWATELDARVSQIEKQNAGSQSIYEKLARIEERMDYVKQDVASIKRQMDQFSERLSRK